VLHRLDVGACGGELLEELINCARREFAVCVDGVMVIKVLEALDVTAVDSSAVGVDESSQLELVDDLLVEFGRLMPPAG
jgi:hypothetical protein